MCTLAAWIGVFPAAPLVVAANRDERLSRAASGPRAWPGEVPLVAPRDDLAGGTWWALSRGGLFVALTNRAGAVVDDHRRSRGQLVLDIARTDSLAAAEAALRALRPTDWNGFHLLAAEGGRGVRALGNGHALRVEALAPGFHLLTERSFGATPHSRDRAALDALSPFTCRPLDLPALGRALATHADDPLEAVCVHVEALDYGTRSSTVLALGPALRALAFADGPPCRTAFEDRSALLAFAG
jgi:uncharacterized protein with NRDE domain